jgi:hypothetical protein
MFQKRLLLAALCVSLLFSVTACPPGQSSDESQSEFFVAISWQGGVTGYLPTGWGWKPNSKVEISIWHEPDGPGSASTQWKKILDESVDPYSMFGFNSGAPFYPVRRNICGHPENGQTVLFMAKNVNTGKIRMRQVPADIYFTFKPCQ